MKNLITFIIGVIIFFILFFLIKKLFKPKKITRRKKIKDRRIIHRKKRKRKLESKKIRAGNKRLEEIFNALKNKELKDILNYLNKIYPLEKLSSRKFDSEEELAKFLKERSVDFLHGRHHELKEEMSKLRKEGRDVNDVDLRLMSIPLKIKLFEVSLNKKDFYKVINLIEKVEKELKKYN